MLRVVERAPRRAAGQRVAHITLPTFSDGAHQQLADAIQMARERGTRGIVLDLRANGGGLVKEAQRGASEFLQAGENVTRRGGAVPDSTPPAVGGTLNLAVGRHFTPDGRNLAGDGIAPGVRAADDHDAQRDEALAVALAVALDVLGRSLDRSAG